VALIQNPSIGRKLQQLLRLTSLPDTVLSPETVPVIVVEDVSDPLLGDGLGCMGNHNQGPVVGEFGIVVLTRVGAPARYRLKVSKVHIATSTTQTMVLSVPTVVLTGLTTSDNTSFRDFDLPGRPASIIGTRTIAAVPFLRVLWQGPVANGQPVVLDVNIDIGTIGKGDDLTSLMISAGTVNTRLFGGFEWTEDSPKG